MVRQCSQPKRPRNATWFKDKAILAEAQESGQILDEEQLAFLTDPGIPDNVSNIKAVLMANLSNYGLDVILEKAQQIKPTMYDGSVISTQHVVILVIDEEETLILEEVSRSKMLAKQNDPISKEKKINTTPINYVELNQLFEDFGKRFVPQQEFSAEQAFWLQTSNPNTEQSHISPVRIKAPSKLPK
nr:retrovirus-related Pol polyprotein from transposon TNT 1-94 [Tanacetum cinerariifolium]